MSDSNTDAFFENLSERNRFRTHTYSNEDLQKLIDGLHIKYASTTYHPHRCDLFKKILELIDVQIARAKSVT